MKPTFWDYVRSAFNARPMGMFVPPNWIGLGVFGFLGLLNPGFWIIGLGLELAYLGRLATDSRFQRLVEGERLLGERRRWQERLADLIRELPAEDQQRYRALERRCGNILEQQLRGATLAPALEEQGEGLGKLVWIYLRLLLTRESIKKIAFLDAELTRIQEQVELLREQAVLSTDPEAVSQRIDQITTTLGGTSQWIRDQQKIYGAMEDLLNEPPPLVVSSSKESQ